MDPKRRDQRVEIRLTVFMWDRLPVGVADEESRQAGWVVWWQHGEISVEQEAEQRGADTDTHTRKGVGGGEGRGRDRMGKNKKNKNPDLHSRTLTLCVHLCLAPSPH